MTSTFHRANPHRLYRSRDHVIIAGVCSGLAEYFGISPILVRVLCIFTFFVSAPLVFFTYVASALLLQRRPSSIYKSSEEENFWRGVSLDARDTAYDIRHRFRTIGDRLGRIESYVTSREYELEGEYQKLERQHTKDS